MLRHPRPRSSSSEHDHASWLKDAEHTRAVFDFELSVQTMQCFPHILFDDAPCGSEPGGKIRGPCRGHASMLLNGHVIPSYLFSLGCWSWWSPHLLSEIHPRKAPPILFQRHALEAFRWCVCVRASLFLCSRCRTHSTNASCNVERWVAVRSHLCCFARTQDGPKAATAAFNRQLGHHQDTSASMNGSTRVIKVASYWSFRHIMPGLSIAKAGEC